MRRVLQLLTHLPTADMVSRSQSPLLLNADMRLTSRMESQIHSQSHSSPGPGLANPCPVSPLSVPAAGMANRS